MWLNGTVLDVGDDGSASKQDNAPDGSILVESKVAQLSQTPRLTLKHAKQAKS